MVGSEKSDSAEPGIPLQCGGLDWQKRSAGESLGACWCGRWQPSWTGVVPPGVAGGGVGFPAVVVVPPLGTCRWTRRWWCQSWTCCCFCCCCCCCCCWIGASRRGLWLWCACWRGGAGRLLAVLLPAGCRQGVPEARVLPQW